MVEQKPRASYLIQQRAAFRGSYAVCPVELERGKSHVFSVSGVIGA